jgi:hypothetical protein
MSDRVMMAIGDSGGYEAMPAREVVQVGSVPVGEDNMIIPATVRYTRRDVGENVPIKLLNIREPNTRLNRRRHPLVTFSCTPFVRYMLKGKPVLGDVMSCFVRNEHDAKDPLFDSLSVKERFRILQSAHNMSVAP